MKYKQKDSTNIIKAYYYIDLNGAL